MPEIELNGEHLRRLAGLARGRSIEPWWRWGFFTWLSFDRLVAGGLAVRVFDRKTKRVGLEITCLGADRLAREEGYRFHRFPS